MTNSSTKLLDRVDMVGPRQSSLLYILLFLIFGAGAVAATSDETGPTGVAPNSLEPVFLEPRALKNLIDLAIENDAHIRAAQFKTDADQSIQKTAQAGLLPRLDLTASYTRLNEVDLPPFDFGSGVAMDNPFPQVLDNYSLKASLAFPLLTYFKSIVPRMKQTENQALLSAAAEQQQKERIAFTTRQLYWGLQMRFMQHRLLERAQTRVKSTLEQMRLLHEAGQLTNVEYDGVETQSLDVAQNLVSNMRQIEIAKRQIVRFVGIDVSDIGTLFAPVDDAMMHDLTIGSAGSIHQMRIEDFVAVATRERPEFDVVTQSIALLESEYDIAARGALPELNLVGQYEYSNPNQRIFPTTAEFNDTWAISAQATWSPNDLIGASTLKKRARAQVEEAHANLNALKRQVRQELEEAHDSLQTVQESITLEKRKLNYEQTRYKNTQQAVLAGTETTFDRIERETAVQNAELALENAYVQFAIARATLLRALGVIFESELQGEQS